MQRERPKMNFFVVHRGSNLVTGIVASSYKPKDTDQYRFVIVTDGILDRHQRLRDSHGSEIDVGNIMAISPGIHDQIVSTKSGVATPKNPRPRAIQYEKVEDPRLQQISEYFVANPYATWQEIADEFLTGEVLAKAYVERFGL